MFGLGGLGIGSKVAIGMGILLLSVSAASAVYFKYSQAKIAELNQEKAVLAVQVATVKQQQKFLEEQMRNQLKANEELNTSIAQIRTETNQLSVLLSKHNLSNLANSKPLMIERRVNAGTVKVFKKLEDITDPASYNVAPKVEPK